LGSGKGCALRECLGKCQRVLMACENLVVKERFDVNFSSHT
jgi:hypothetical protein